MPCPHSFVCSHAECSQCAEASGDLEAKIQRVARDEETGALSIDGVPVERGFVPTQPSSRYATIVAKRRRAKVAIVAAAAVETVEDVDDLD